MEEMETGEEPEAESDEDYYDDTYANRRKRRGGATPTGPGSRGGRTRKSQPDDTPAKRGRAVSEQFFYYYNTIRFYDVVIYLSSANCTVT